MYQLALAVLPAPVTTAGAALPEGHLGDLMLYKAWHNRIPVSVLPEHYPICISASARVSRRGRSRSWQLEGNS